MADEYEWAFVRQVLEVVKYSVPAISVCDVLVYAKNERNRSIRGPSYAPMEFQVH